MEGLYALAGVLFGALGTILVELVRSRRESLTAKRALLAAACAEFAGQTARVRRYALQARRIGADPALLDRMEVAFNEARAAYERLALVSESVETTTAARYVLHFNYWMTRIAQGEPFDWADTIQSFFGWQARLYTAVRRELGNAHPENVFRDPPGGLPSPAAAHQDPGMSLPPARPQNG